VEEINKVLSWNVLRGGRNQ